MKKYRVEIAPRALLEIQEQARVIAADKPRAAEQWLRRLLDAVEICRYFRIACIFRRDRISRVGIGGSWFFRQASCMAKARDPNNLTRVVNTIEYEVIAKNKLP